MDLKGILNQVMAQSAFLTRTVWAGAQDTEAIQLVAFANRAAHEILNFYNWGKLRQEHLITCTTDLAYPLPADFTSYIPETMWRNYGARVICVPTSDRLWGYLKASNPGAAYQYYAKFLNSNLEFISVIPGDVITFDYVGKYAVRSSGGALKEYFSVDTDTWELNDRTLINGIQYFWKVEKEIATAVQARQDFYSDLRNDISDDTGAVVIRSPRLPNAYPGAPPISTQYQL